MPNTKNVTFPADDALDDDAPSPSSTSSSAKMAPRSQATADYRIIRQAQPKDQKELRHIPSPPWASDSYVSTKNTQDPCNSLYTVHRDATGAAGRTLRSDARHLDAAARRDGRSSRSVSLSRSETSGEEGGRAESAKLNARYHPYAPTSSPAPHPRLYHQPHHLPPPPDSSETGSSCSSLDPPNRPSLATAPYIPHRPTRPRQRHDPIGTATVKFGSASPPPTPPISAGTRATDGSLSPSPSSPDTSMEYDNVQLSSVSRGKPGGRRSSGDRAAARHHSPLSSSSALSHGSSYYRNSPSSSSGRQNAQDLETIIDPTIPSGPNNHTLSGLGQNHYRTQYCASNHGGPSGTANGTDPSVGGRVSRSVSASTSTASSSTTSTSPVFLTNSCAPPPLISAIVTGSNSNTFAAPARPSRKTKKYPCDICGAIFTRSGDVRRHKESKHDPGEGCKCPYCDRVLTRQDALQRHWDKYCRQKSKRHVDKPPTGTPGTSSSKSSINPSPSSQMIGESQRRAPKRIRNTSGAAALLSAAAAVAASGAEDSDDVRMRDPRDYRAGESNDGRDHDEDEDDDDNDMAAHSTATVTPATYRHIPASSASGMFSVISPSGASRPYVGGGRRAAAASTPSTSGSPARWTSTPPPSGPTPPSSLTHASGSVASTYASSSSGNNGGTAASATNPPYPGPPGYPPQYKYYQPPSSTSTYPAQQPVNPRDAHKTAAHFEQPQSSRRSRNSRGGTGGAGPPGGAGIGARSTSSHLSGNGITNPTLTTKTTSPSSPSGRRSSLRDKGKARAARGTSSHAQPDDGASNGNGIDEGRLTLSSLAAAAAISAPVPVPSPINQGSSSSSSSPTGGGNTTHFKIDGSIDSTNGNGSHPTQSLARENPPGVDTSMGSGAVGPGGHMDVVHSPASWAGDEDAEGEDEDAAMVMVQLGKVASPSPSVAGGVSGAKSSGHADSDLGEGDADGEGDEDVMDVDEAK